MMFDQLLRTIATFARYRDRPEKHALLREHSRRIERHYSSGDLSFTEWARLMAVLLRSASGHGADAVA